MRCNPSSGIVRHQDEGSELMAKPREELHSNPKSIANCKELHLGRRGITCLPDDMEAFRSLEVLWLNDNSLSDITSLDFNPTMRSLHAHNNRIKTLKGSLLGFKFLHTLTLGNNRIDNLQRSLDVLKFLRHLRYLDLTGNPLADETGYRLLVLKTLPWLETLDMHKTNNNKNMSWEGRRGSISVPLPAEHPTKIRARTMLEKELSRMRETVKNHRVLLKEWFRAEDPRREGLVLESLFIRCLRQHGLWPPTEGTAVESLKRTEGVPKEGTTSNTTSAAPATLLTGKTGLLASTLLEAFRVHRPPTRARFLGRDPVYQGQIFINYVAFCGAVEPKHGGRDPDNSQGERGERGERELDKARKAKSATQDFEGMPACRERGGVGPASLRRQEELDGCDRGRDGEKIELLMTSSRPRRHDLRSSLQLLESRVALDGMPLSWHGHLRGTANFPRATLVSCCKYTSKEKAPNAGGSVGGLDHLERIELKRAFFEAQRGDLAETTPTMISRAQALSALKAMEIRGRRPRIFSQAPPPSTDEDSFNQLSEASRGRSSETTASAERGGQSTNFDVLFDAAVVETSKDGVNEASRSAVTGTHEHHRGMADIAVLMRTLKDGVSAAPAEGVMALAPLEWVWLSRVEAEERARELYREASFAQRRLLLLVSDDEDDAVRLEAAAPIHENIAVLTRNAARLENLAAAAAAAEYSFSAPVHDDPKADAVAAGRAHRTSLGGYKKRPSYNRAPAASPPGRVDFLVACEYHGYPFKRWEGDKHGQRSEESPESSPRLVKVKNEEGSKIARGAGSQDLGEMAPWFSRTVMIAGG